MEKSLKTKVCLLLLLAVASAMVLFAVRGIAGAVKTDATNTYQISDDTLSAAGSPGVAGSNYWLAFSAGQPIGHVTMTDPTYSLEGGYVSGITSVFQITKTIFAVEKPVGYTGGANDIVPGARLTYRINFTNTGEAAQPNSTTIDDPVPSTLQFASGSIQLTVNNTTYAPLTDTLDSDPCAFMATQTVHCLLPSVPAGATGSLTFKTIVK